MPSRKSPAYNRLVPEETADQTVAADRSRISELEAERDRLQNELDTIANRALDRWLAVEQYESGTIAALQQTLSWKVTKPLRSVRERQLQARRVAARLRRNA